MSAPRPPRWTRALLRRLLPDGTREEVLRDLDELWRERAEARGVRAANRWYRRQVARAVGPSLKTTLLAGSREGGHAAGGGESLGGSLRRDVGYALGGLRRRPGVGATVVATLAVAIGATTAIFSVVHGVLLRPLPYDEPSELVMVTSEVGGSSQARYVSGPDAVEMVQAVDGLGEMAALVETTVGPMTRVGRPEHVLTTPVTWNLFRVLGVEVALGRGFVPEDAAPVPEDAADPPPRSAVISHDLWQRSFGGDPDVIGTVVHIWGGATEIVGVLPEGLRLVVPPELNIPPDGEVWHALRWDMARSSREQREYRLVARLSGGASVEVVGRQADVFARHLRSTHRHHAAEETGFRVTSLEEAAAAPLRGPLWLLMGSVTLVLLIACANVANLLLAHGTTRAREMAVRVSLGAGGGRLVRQLLTESAVMAILGAAGGAVLAVGGIDLLHALRPDDLHRLETVRLDVPVLGFTVVVAVLATVLSGLVPALHTARSGLAGRLRERGGTGAGQRWRRGLVVTEVALSMILLVGAGLLIRTFTELQSMPLGFEPDRVLTVTATQPARSLEERSAYEAELVRAAAEVPGVRSAGIVFPLPMNGVYERTAEYVVDGRETAPSAWTTAYFRTVSSSYFETMGLEIEAGRGFTRADEDPDLPVVIVDERLAGREFPGRNPVGERLRVRGMQDDTLVAEIVGVVEHAPQWDHRDTRPAMYFPRVFYRSHEVSVVAKVTGDPAGVAPLLSQAIRGVDPSFPADLVAMEELVRERLSRSRFLLVLMQIFGALALGLSAVGIYGVLSFSVRRRTRELGLRLALGAEARDLTGAVVWRGVALTGVGVGVGLVGAVVLGRGLRSQLHGVGITDPWSLGGAAALILTVAAAASLVPALRAARIEPSEALREE